MPPTRRTDENRIVFRNRFLIKQVRHSGTQVVVGFTLDAVAVIIRICGIRFGSLNPMDVSTRKLHDSFRYGPGVSFSGEVNHKHITVPGRSIRFIRISRIFRIIGITFIARFFGSGGLLRRRHRIIIGRTSGHSRQRKEQERNKK